MTWTVRLAIGVGVLSVGYLLGRLDGLRVSEVVAQEPAIGPSEDTAKRIQTANDALKVAVEALKAESLYNPATKSLNTFAVMVGGVDAVADLESGRGVDPETFAGLYAGDETDDVQPHLGKDEQGRVTYKNKVVRLYPISRLQRLLAQRKIVTGEARPAVEMP
jgi:hypothetical protein